MGITLSRKRDAAVGSIACMAAIPREETARLIDRCWAAACEEGRRTSNVNVHKSVECREVEGEGIPGRASYISTTQPMFARAIATRQPTGPAPTTTSFFVMVGVGESSFAGRVWHGEAAVSRSPAHITHRHPYLRGAVSRHQKNVDIPCGPST
jgi:hypothetical protein